MTIDRNGTFILSAVFWGRKIDCFNGRFIGISSINHQEQCYTVPTFASGFQFFYIESFFDTSSPNKCASQIACYKSRPKRDISLLENDGLNTDVFQAK